MATHLLVDEEILVLQYEHKVQSFLEQVPVACVHCLPKILSFMPQIVSIVPLLVFWQVFLFKRDAKFV